MENLKLLLINDPNKDHTNNYDNYNNYSYNITAPFENLTLPGVAQPDLASIHKERVQDTIYLTLYSTACALALFGNSLVCKVVFTRASMRTFTNILLVNMALSDILCALTFPTGLFVCWDTFIAHTPLKFYACLTVKMIQLVSFQVSSVTMTVVAVDRFMMVFQPLKRRFDRRMFPIYVVILAIWVVSTLIVGGTSPSLAFHRYFWTHGSPSSEFEPFIKCQVEVIFATSSFQQRVQLVIANLAHFWVPLTVITLCYGSIAWKVLRRKKVHGTMTPQQEELLLRTKWKTVKMLIAAVAVFFLCWFPFFISNLLDFFGNSERKRPCNKSGTFFLAVWVAFTSCCYNPFVYWIYSQEFREGLKSFGKITRSSIMKLVPQSISRSSAVVDKVDPGPAPELDTSGQ